MRKTSMNYVPLDNDGNPIIPESCGQFQPKCTFASFTCTGEEAQIQFNGASCSMSFDVVEFIYNEMCNKRVQ